MVHGILWSCSIKHIHFFGKKLLSYPPLIKALVAISEIRSARAEGARRETAVRDLKVGVAEAVD